jgi:zinc transport system substrate-binding protein
MRWLTLLLILLLFLSVKCTNRKEESKTLPSITVSIRPQKYLIEQIAGDRFNIHILVPDGSGPETYEPTPKQMQEISKSRACFITGLLDFEKSWINEVSGLYPDILVVDLSQGVNLIISEQGKTGGHEGHQHDAEDHQDHQHHHQNHNEVEGHNHSGTDPHIWLSLKELKIQSNNVLKTLVELDPDSKGYYTNNHSNFVKYLDSSDAEIQSKISSYGKQVVYMIYHPSLSYFARDYNLEQIPIELEGKEPGPGYMKELIDIAKAKGLKTIYYSPQLDKRSPETIAQQLGIKAKQFNDLEEDIVKNLLNLTEQLTSRN